MRFFLSFSSVASSPFIELYLFTFFFIFFFSRVSVCDRLKKKKKRRRERKTLQNVVFAVVRRLMFQERG